MPTSQSVSQFVIFHPKDGVNLEDAGSKAAQTFTQMTKMCADAHGFVSQYWGHQVENPHIFVWYIEWESAELHLAFTKTEVHASLESSFQQLLDPNAAVPPLLIFASLSPDGTAALAAPVTEVAFFTITNTGAEEADTKAAMERALEPVGDAVITVGKAWGQASGWVSLVLPPTAGPPPSSDGWFTGIFGYASIDDHMKWREQPEHAKIGEIFADLERRGISMKPAAVPGVDPETGYFHVKFVKG